MSQLQAKDSNTMEVKRQWIPGLLGVSATVQSFNTYWLFTERDSSKTLCSHRIQIKTWELLGDALPSPSALEDLSGDALFSPSAPDVVSTFQWVNMLKGKYLPLIYSTHMTAQRQLRKWQFCVLNEDVKEWYQSPNSITFRILCISIILRASDATFLCLSPFPFHTQGEMAEEILLWAERALVRA